MTKNVAILEMLTGERVTHRYFNSHEWVTIERGMYVFEDGVKIKPSEFWSTRNSEDWKEDWSIFK